MKPVRYLLAIVLPPVAVFLAYGVSTTLVISILLTLLGWVPGIIHALWALTRYDEMMNPENL
ncbi:YqaE/Pmp3 family membrane protein [Alkalinema sp. FACHB-956]|uniref:YqaE/Pmp3 family membrane protein n=1 Tax=Alkalinema sp. FACHB-956 TaxID=2692768 RepID=UPI0016888DC4|nr:YqaE/Pmp3 family membrane protein [Alkalinema sp. FACHB-956]MBD2328016.1 YqaE/Pmp3 family membrane protein [Alkalinema sp. FACHB-956]